MSELLEAVVRSRSSKIWRGADEEVLQDFVFAPDFPGFSGHFPARPVLPAVVMLLASRLLAESVSAVPLRLAGVKQAKFLLPIAPLVPVRIELRNGGSRGWSVRVLASGRLAATFILLLVEDR